MSDDQNNKMNLILYDTLDETITKTLGKINILEFFKGLVTLSINSEIHKKLLLSYLNNYFEYKVCIYIITVLSEYETFYLTVFNSKNKQEDILKENHKLFKTDKSKDIIYIYIFNS